MHFPFNPSVFLSAFFIVWAFDVVYNLRHMADESDCFDGGAMRSIAFAIAAICWSALCGILVALLSSLIYAMVAAAAAAF